MILEIKNGCFGYPKQDIILSDINLSLEEGHILAILGPNGIGKTTLLKCMIGLLPWREGTTFLYGQDIKTLKPKELWSNVSSIPQSHGFAFSYTGLEMVMLGRCSHLGVFEQPGRREIEMAEAMMEKTGITHLAKKDCNRMSGGELQMVLIARALINEPALPRGRHQRNHEHALSDQRRVCRRRGFYDESQRHFFLRQHGKSSDRKEYFRVL